MLRRINRSRSEPLHISTVFLGLDHNFWGGGKPIVFETMIFGGQHLQYQTRYCEWDEAEEGVLSHLGIRMQITESGAELKVYEGIHDPSGEIVGDETGLRTESVQFIEDEHCNRVPASNMAAVLDLISGSDESEGNGKGGYERGREMGMNSDKVMM